MRLARVVEVARGQERGARITQFGVAQQRLILLQTHGGQVGRKFGLVWLGCARTTLGRLVGPRPGLGELLVALVVLEMGGAGGWRCCGGRAEDEVAAELRAAERERRELGLVAGWARGRVGLVAAENGAELVAVHHWDELVNVDRAGQVHGGLIFSLQVGPDHLEVGQRKPAGLEAAGAGQSVTSAPELHVSCHGLVVVVATRLDCYSLGRTRS